MTALHEAISEYLTLRRALGFKLAGQDRLLADFVDHLEQTGAAAITVEAAVTWAIKPATAQPIRWRARLCVVRGFARYLSTVDPTVEVPAVDVLPHRHHRPTPYLFSPADIAALLAATNQIRSPLLALTYRVLFGLLAATGMRVSEAIRLDDADVDLTAGLVSIRQTKFNKSRQLPLHATTVTTLRHYVAQRDQLGRRLDRTASPFFMSTVGTRLIYTNVANTFRKLLKTSGARSESGTSPRVHALRHSFAVATLLGWYHDGGDVQARLPLLSAYLGHSHPNSIYWYLQAAPELLALAAARLEPFTEVSQ